ncbi:MAG: hypothetical protein HY763_06075 [Planctomycetes bacterium]|nr:hypothetical protein [Planctomycetota bacterium]
MNVQREFVAVVRSGIGHRAAARFLFVLVAGCLAAAVSGGCQDPRFKHDQAMRDKRVKHVADLYVRREKAGPVNMKAVANTEKMLGTRRVENLKKTLKTAERVEERRQQKPVTQAPLRKRQTKALLGGKPEKIPRTWADTAY